MQAIRDLLGDYSFHGSVQPLSEAEILEAAQDILFRRLQRLGSISRPTDASDYLRHKLGAFDHEVFCVLWLDNRHQILGFQTLFEGSISGASVYPREVVRAALRVNAAACILAHNHPSGVTEPSQADREMTQTLVTALRTIEVRVLDHIIVGAGTLSMAERGCL
jgi:DNA repair protein RadC